MGGRQVTASRTPPVARTRRPIAAAVAALLLLASLATALPAPALASDVSFGDPKAKATYGESIVFTVDVTAGVPIERAELRLRFPDSLGPLIVDVPTPAGTGTQTLRYELDLTGDGHIVPNTPIEATWATWTSADGEPTTSRAGTFRYEDTSHDWKTVGGDLMTVHWYEGGKAFAEKALRIGEQAIRDTSTLLGVTETKPVDFYIYGDQASFRDALGPSTRENVGGQAHADIRTLFALIGPNEIDDPWVGIVVPHELVHLVFDTAVRNPYRFPPRWLNEGLATYLSEGYSSDSRGRVRRASDNARPPAPRRARRTVPDRSREDLPRLRRVRVGDRLPRAQGRPGQARGARDRVRRRAHRRRGVHQGDRR